MNQNGEITPDALAHDMHSSIESVMSTLATYLFYLLETSLKIHRALEDFQKGEARTFIAHIEAGLEELNRTKGSLLVFSGFDWIPHSQNPSTMLIATTEDPRNHK